jgi:hypothetical protein
MTQALYREFVLRGPTVWPAVIAFVKANAASFAAKGEPLRLIFTSDEKRRTLEQNRFFHGPVLDAITAQAWWDGRQYPKEFWKEYFRKLYLLKGEYETPDGEIVQVYWSTADLSVGAMAEFLTKVQADASSDWGVIFE